MARTTAFQRSVCAMRHGTAAARSTRTMPAAAAPVVASGFSMSSGFRAAATASVTAGWRAGGTTATTASTAGSATSDRQSAWKRQPRRAASSRPRVASRRETAAAASSGTSRRCAR